MQCGMVWCGGDHSQPEVRDLHLPTRNQLTTNSTCLLMSHWDPDFERHKRVPGGNSLSDLTPNLQASSSEISVISSLNFLHPLQVGYSFRLENPQTLYAHLNHHIANNQRA